MTKLSAWRKAGAVLLLWAATTVATTAQTLTTVVDFDGANGSNPLYGSLAQGADGSLYGTTYTGGKSDDGTVFKITKDGVLGTLYTFCSLPNCSDGSFPTAGLVLGTDGNFYGTASYGGDLTCSPPLGCGTVFRITPGGELTTLYSFCAQPNCTDGYTPVAGLVQGTDGNLYGTTQNGGASFNGCTIDSAGCGTAFKITPDGVLTMLYSFCAQSNCTDGANPDGRLIQGSDGNFYGTTWRGGANGVGTVFRLSPAEGTLATLHSFDGSDGTNPVAGLVQATDGNFYGTTEGGGSLTCSAGCGTVFKMNAGGKLTTLYSFCIQTNCTDGYTPMAGLVQGTDGNFYGTTGNGGMSDYGTIFEITPGGALTTLYSFCTQTNCTDGATPYGGLVEGTNGTLYGSTFYGGVDSDGTVFSLSKGLGPFVIFVRAAGKVGEMGPILGQGFTGTTSVAINGIPADFTVISDTDIRATVPAGATTGYVTVTTPSGTLTSNVPFHVIP